MVLMMMVMVMLLILVILIVALLNVLLELVVILLLVLIGLLMICVVSARHVLALVRAALMYLTIRIFGMIVVAVSMPVQAPASVLVLMVIVMA